MVGARTLVWLLLAWPCLACGDDDDVNSQVDAGQAEPRGGRGGDGGRAATAGRSGSSGRDGGGGAGGGAGGRAGVGGVAGMSGAGGGGRGGGGGGGQVAGASGASNPWSHCPAAVHANLSEWCAMDGKACDASFDERLRRVCQIVGPSPNVGTAAFVSNNDCGGRSINYILAVDAYNATHHYDAAGKLIGVDEATTPCSGVRDVYGMACKHDFGNGAFDCSMLDTDAGD